MAEQDPFELLSLPRDASRAEVESARRRLAMSLHPDRGGDGAAMQQVNRAADRALEAIDQRAAAGADRGERTRGRDRGASGSADVAESDESRARHRRGASLHDHPSFVVEALPAVAHEALLAVARSLGEVIEDDPPYLLEAHLDDETAGRVWCRLEILPEAGSSSVGLSVASIDRTAGGAVVIERIRDRWIAGLNDLDWSEL